MEFLDKEYDMVEANYHSVCNENFASLIFQNYLNISL